MRLIDADKLIDYFYYGIDDKPIIDGISDRKIIDTIKKQPTAYSVDKVVEELEKELSLADKEKERCTGENNLQFDSAKGYASGISTAIEIVKAGVKNENWNWDTKGIWRTF